jgi:hypothetical protein
VDAQKNVNFRRIMMSNIVKQLDSFLPRNQINFRFERCGFYNRAKRLSDATNFSKTCEPTLIAYFAPHYADKFEIRSKFDIGDSSLRDVRVSAARCRGRLRRLLVSFPINRILTCCPCELSAEKTQPDAEDAS